MSAITIQLDAREALSLLNRLRNRIPQVERRYLEQAGRLTVREMKARAPVRTGRLRQSIRAIIRMGGVEVSPHVPYWVYVERGVRPHMVFPRRPRGVLAFQTEGGETVFARHVRHPGFLGRFFVRDTQVAVRPRLRLLLHDIIHRELKRHV
jgi:hypothetical protein